MEPDRHVEALGRGPERFVIGVVDHLVVVRVGAQERALEAELLSREAHLLDRVRHRWHWQHRHAEQPVGVGTAVIGKPAVIGAAQRGGEVGVVHGAGKEPHAWIEKGGVDAVEIHVGDALVRVEPARPALLISQLGRRDSALPRADAADAAEAALRVTGRALLNDQPALTALLLDKAWRPIAVLGVGVFVPQVERLQDVAVGVDDVVNATHAAAPFWLTIEPNGRLIRTLCPAPKPVNRPALTLPRQRFGCQRQTATVSGRTVNPPTAATVQKTRERSSRSTI